MAGRSGLPSSSAAHRQCSTGCVVVPATCATSPLSQTTSKTKTKGEDGVSSFASRMTHGIFFGHQDRIGAVLCIAKNGVVRGKSWSDTD